MVARMMAGEGGCVVALTPCETLAFQAATELLWRHIMATLPTRASINNTYLLSSHDIILGDKTCR